MIMHKVYSVAIIGVGSRGGDTYLSEFSKRPDKFKVVALCDILQAKIDKYAPMYNIDKQQCFTSVEKFFEEKRADILCVSTPDKFHIQHAIAGLRLGYDLLLEKPISDKKEELDELMRVQNECGGKVCVCHVLRYAPGFVKVASLLDAKVIGDLIHIESVEQVEFFHQAHSYVRGNWRSREETTPMIMAKCCHDLDLMQYYAKSQCVSVSSMGALTYFKKENMPADATPRCIDCPHKDDCAYSATTYIKRWHAWGEQENAWPWNVITLALPMTEEAIMAAIENGPYGRCVFDCDNDVVDHQQTLMQFANGVTATLTMTAFTAVEGREMRFHGTKGDLIFSGSANTITVRIFGGETTVIDLMKLVDGGHAHGGGDGRMVDTLYDILKGEESERTSLATSIESHLMAIAAETSRLAGGALVKVHE